MLKLFFFNFILFFFLINITNVKASILNSPLVFEMINDKGEVEFSGMYTNLDAESNIYLKFVAKDEYGEIIEAIKIPIELNSTNIIGSSDKIYYNFVINSKPGDIYSRELYFTNE
jgi:hypothetical protein